MTPQERSYSPGQSWTRKDDILSTRRTQLLDAKLAWLLRPKYIRLYSFIFAGVLVAGAATVIVLCPVACSDSAGQADAARSRTSNGRWVCLDPGHSAGGPSSIIDPESGLDVADCPGEPGELQANWDLAMELKPMLERKGYRVKLTKTSMNSYADLKRRAETGSTCSIMLRLHCDASFKAIFHPVVGQFKAHGGKRVDVDHDVARDSTDLALAMFPFLKEVGIPRVMDEMGGHTDNTGTAYVVSALSRVPVVLIENDPVVVQDPAGRARVARMIVNGIEAWFRAGDEPAATR